MSRTGTPDEAGIIRAMVAIGDDATAIEISAYMIGTDAWDRRISGRLHMMAKQEKVKKIIRTRGRAAHWRLMGDVA